MTKRITGVGFLLFHDGKIFTVKELKDKPSIKKRSGMVSFPLETVEDDDITIENTILRLLKEECGISPDDVAIGGIIEEEFRLIPDRNDIVTHYGYGVFIGDISQDFNPQDTDIVFNGWIKPDDLLEEDVRIEVRPILTHFYQIVFR